MLEQSTKGIDIIIAGEDSIKYNEVMARFPISRLFSYWYIKGSKIEKIKQVIEIYKDKYQERSTILLDSGAFSAWNKGAAIDIDEYISFYQKLSSHVDYIVNLDMIPGKPWQKKLSKGDIEEAATVGWKNYRYILSKGIPKEKIIHVFHQGERFKWLDRMIKEGLSYIGISPQNDKSTEEKRMWLDECMKHITNGQGIPTIKFHGFGVTSPRLLFRYPWWSVDSTAWRKHAGYGFIDIPSKDKGKYLFHREALQIFVSIISPYRKKKGRHIDSLVREERENVFSYIRHKGYKIGKSEFRQEDEDYMLKEHERWTKHEGKKVVETIIEYGLCNDILLRCLFNIDYYMDLMQSIPAWPRPFNVKMKGFL